MIEYEQVNGVLVQVHEHTFNKLYKCSGLQPFMNVEIPLICSSCGKRATATGFFDGRSVSGEELLIEEDETIESVLTL